MFLLHACGTSCTVSDCKLKSAVIEKKISPFHPDLWPRVRILCLSELVDDSSSSEGNKYLLQGHHMMSWQCSSDWKATSLQHRKPQHKTRECRFQKREEHVKKNTKY